MTELSPRDVVLLIRLRRGNHFKVNPGNVVDLLPGEPVEEAHAAARRLLATEMVRKVEQMGDGFWLRITDKGMAAADIAIDKKRPPSLRERIRNVPIGKGLWDVFKILFGVALGIVATKYFGSK